MADCLHAIFIQEDVSLQVVSAVQFLLICLLCHWSFLLCCGLFRYIRVKRGDPMTRYIPSEYCDPRGNFYSLNPEVNLPAITPLLFLRLC